ncbi:MAG: FGGY family carbohydrate kinase, partial [Planctomycetota bacterium]
SVMTMGADGAPVTADGRLTHPPICWQCRRTEPVAERLADSIGRRRLYEITGYHVIRFNTLFALAWLRKNAPEALDDAKCWMMMAGLLSHRLCGEMSIDYPGASTMMAMDLRQRTWSEKLLALADLEAGFFPRFVESGGTIGTVTAEASAATGIPEGTPVTAAGHDTQFAPIGSGVQPGEAILSTGTWEILMVRVPEFTPNDEGFEGGLIIEFDALPGLYDPQLLMMGSGVIEWLAKHFYGELESSPQLYETMIREAHLCDAGSGGVMLLPSFVAGTGPTKGWNTLGTVLGLTISTERGQVYRAALEGLCCQLQLAIEMLESATGASPEGIRVVGGGSKNDLWNQLRAEVTGLPVTTIEQKEATVLGAAICAFAGTGVHESVEAAQRAIRFGETTFQPSADRGDYEALYARYKALLPALEPHYSGP